MNTPPNSPTTDLRFSRTLSSNRVWLAAGRRAIVAGENLRVFGHIPETCLGQQANWRRRTSEARDAAEKRPSARETLAAIRAKAAEASEAARRASEDARLNAAEAANAARLAAKGTAERAAELLQLEQLAAELQQRSEEMQAQLLRTPRIVGPRRMLRAYPKLRHGSKLRSLPTLREMLHRAEQENKDDNKNTK